MGVCEPSLFLASACAASASRLIVPSRRSHCAARSAMARVAWSNGRPGPGREPPGPACARLTSPARSSTTRCLGLQPPPILNEPCQRGSAAAHDRAGDPLRVCGRREQDGRGSDVRGDEVRRAQIGLGDELGRERAHRPRGQQVLPAFGCAGARQVNGERRACPESEAHIGANAYTLSGQGLVSTTAGFASYRCRRTADRQPRPFGSPILAAARRGTNHGHAVTRRAKWASELPR